jgi:hypothetical protein
VLMLSCLSFFQYAAVAMFLCGLIIFSRKRELPPNLFLKVIFAVIFVASLIMFNWSSSKSPMDSCRESSVGLMFLLVLIGYVLYLLSSSAWRALKTFFAKM